MLCLAQGLSSQSRVFHARPNLLDIMYMWRRRALVAIGAPIAAVACIPAEEHTPSGIALLSYLGATRISSVVPRGKRAPSLEVAVHVGTAEVHLCGVCHVEQASAAAAHAMVARDAPDAIALECDDRTLDLLRTAGAALDGVPREVVRSDGLRMVRQALFKSEHMQDLARRAGKPLTDPSNVGLPPAIGRHLANDGVLWSDEMRAAASAADSCGARVVCLGPTKEAAAAPAASRLGMMVGMAATWLRARALHPGLDERSCDEAVVHAANSALREVLPAFHRYHVMDPDAVMASRIRALCEELVRERKGKGRRPRVVCVVGAQHVPGLRRALDVG